MTKAKKTSATSAPSPLGNKFEYWVPKATSGKPPLPPPPLSTLPLSGSSTAATATKTKKVALDTPMGYVEDNFKLATEVPFGSLGSIGIEHEHVTPSALYAAAVECGYGPQAYWTARLLLSPLARSELATHLLLRLEWIRSAMSTTSSSALTMSEFYERIESSEKLTVSFTLGSLFAYLCARIWLKKAGEEMTSFLHTGIYTAAIGTAPAAIPFLAKTKKRPDFLVKASSGEWHVFESKGGNHANRYKRIVQGLHQLHGLPQFGWAGKAPQYARAVVCVHTSVDAGLPISVLAVDPPGSEDGSTDRERENEKSHPIELVWGVAKLLVLIQTIEFFDAISTSTSDSWPDDGEDQYWLIVNVRRNDSQAVAIPRSYKKHENRCRGALAAYFAARDLFDASPDGTTSSSKQSLSAQVKDRLSKAGMPTEGAESALSHALSYADRLDERNAPTERLPFLEFCSEQLLVDSLVLWLHVETGDNHPPPDGFGSDYVRTTGGMVISSIREPGPEADSKP